MKFKVGDRVKVVKKGQSAASKNLFGRIGVIIKTGFNHCVLDIESPNCTGIYYDELVLVGGDFNWTINQMEKGKKVRRPGWEDDSYIKMGSCGIILFKDDTPAKIHGNQILANDWELFKENEFNLSEKICHDEALWTEDVKEFIRLLKEKIPRGKVVVIDFREVIDKLAGSKLI